MKTTRGTFAAVRQGAGRSPYQLRRSDRLILGFLCFLLPLCGCVSTRIIDPDQNAFYNDKVMVFTYGGWSDENANGNMDYNEFTDFNKRIFHDGDFVHFALSTHGQPLGAPGQWRLFAPNASEPTEKSDFTIGYHNNVHHVGYNVGVDLLAQYGPGEYRMEWYLNGTFVGSSRIAVIAPTPASKPARPPERP